MLHPVPLPSPPARGQTRAVSAQVDFAAPRPRGRGARPDPAPGVHPPRLHPRAQHPLGAGGGPWSQRRKLRLRRRRDQPRSCTARSSGAGWDSGFGPEPERKLSGRRGPAPAPAPAPGRRPLPGAAAAGGSAAVRLLLCPRPPVSGALTGMGRVARTHFLVSAPNSLLLAPQLAFLFPSTGLCPPSPLPTPPCTAQAHTPLLSLPLLHPLFPSPLGPFPSLSVALPLPPSSFLLSHSPLCLTSPQPSLRPSIPAVQ